VARWPIAITLMMVAVAVLYWVAPNVEQKFHLVSPGAVMFTLVWAAATFLFGLYVSNFSSYNATYGALGGIVVLLLWFYISSAMFLVGAELNAIIDSQLDPDAVRDRREKALEATRKPTEQERVEEQAHGVPPLELQPARQETARLDPGPPPRTSPAYPGSAGAAPQERGPGLATKVLAAFGLIAAVFAFRRATR
jgi:hypothetical protein